MRSILFGFCLGVSALAAPAAVPPQLNVTGFGACLNQAHPVSAVSELEPLVARYHFAANDGFLVYLALYPGKYLPLISDTVQKPAIQRWSGQWEPLEARLAERIAAGEQAWLPGTFYAQALAVCNDEPFCAALLSHNVLRTLGRNDQAIFHNPKTGEVEDRNPAWFRGDRARWTALVAKIQQRLIPLRNDGGGEQWGEWYHFWGVVAFGIHEAALGKAPGTIDFAAALNQYVNPWFAGGPEDPVKARVDRDSALVVRDYLKWQSVLDGEDCSSPSAYVLPKPPKLVRFSRRG